ncbi:MAG: SMC-Scp complex subunit ScpB [Deltaproteobacteria bacterium]|nr:SMC-Scp complex subunit ScpB [Deltaproteobacteria bacterium]
MRGPHLFTNQTKRIVESLLFAAEKPLTVDQLLSILQGSEREEVREVLAELCREFNLQERGFYLEEVAGGYQFRSSPQYVEWVRKLRHEKPHRLSRAALETLAIVAYRQPVARAEIEAIRGVEVGGILRSLLEKGLIRILGRRDEPGRPLVYGTTSKFLEVFGLKDLSSLPTLPEVESLGKSDSDIENKRPLDRGDKGERERVNRAEETDVSGKNPGT